MPTTPFEDNASDEYSAPLYLICPEPPDVVDIPADPEFDLTNDDLERLTLVDCSADDCQTFKATEIENDAYITEAGLVSVHQPVQRAAPSTSSKTTTPLQRMVVCHSFPSLES